MIEIRNVGRGTLKLDIETRKYSDSEYVESGDSAAFDEALMVRISEAEGQSARVVIGNSSKNYGLNIYRVTKSTCRRNPSIYPDRKRQLPIKPGDSLMVVPDGPYDTAN